MCALVSGVAGRVVAVEQLDTVAVDCSRVDERAFFGGFVRETPGVDELQGPWVDCVCTTGETGRACLVC